MHDALDDPRVPHIQCRAHWSWKPPYSIPLVCPVRPHPTSHGRCHCSASLALQALSNHLPRQITAFPVRRVNLPTVSLDTRSTNRRGS